MTTVETEPPPTTYSSVEVVELTGCTYRQIDYWARTGRLRETATGTGSHRRFTAHDVQLARYLKALLDYGLELERAVTIARTLALGSHVVHVHGDVSITIRAITDTALPNPEGEPA